MIIYGILCLLFSSNACCFQFCKLHSKKQKKKNENSETHKKKKNLRQSKVSGSRLAIINVLSYFKSNIVFEKSLLFLTIMFKYPFFLSKNIKLILVWCLLVFIQPFQHIKKRHLDLFVDAIKVASADFLCVSFN